MGLGLPARRNLLGVNERDNPRATKNGLHRGCRLEVIASNELQNALICIDVVASVLYAILVFGVIVTDADIDFLLLPVQRLTNIVFELCGQVEV